MLEEPRVENPHLEDKKTESHNVEPNLSLHVGYSTVFIEIFR